MVHRSVATLIDQSVLPALLVIFGKVGGVFLANFIYKLTPTFVIVNRLPQFVYPTSAQFHSANTLSNMLMFAFVTLGASVVVFRAHFLHESHISPKVSVRLSKFRISSWMADTFRLYHQGAVWLIFTWLTTVILVLQAYDGVSSPILAIIAFLTSLNLSWLFVIDMDKEIQLSQKIDES